jgi:hypothetical protein
MLRMIPLRALKSAGEVSAGAAASFLPRVALEGAVESEGFVNLKRPSDIPLAAIRRLRYEPRRDTSPQREAPI